MAHYLKVWRKVEREGKAADCGRRKEREILIFWHDIRCCLSIKYSGFNEARWCVCFQCKIVCIKSNPTLSLLVDTYKEIVVFVSTIQSVIVEG